MTQAQWTRISTMKHLCCDDAGVQWKALPGFNSFLCNIPWQYLDRESIKMY